MEKVELPWWCTKQVVFDLISFYFEYFRVFNLIIKPWAGWWISLNMHFYCHRGKPTPTLECKPTSDSSLFLPELQEGFQWFFLPYLWCFHGQTSMCFMKVVIQRQWHGDPARQTTHKHSLCSLMESPEPEGTGNQEGFSCALGEDITCVWQWVRARINEDPAEQGDGAVLTFLLSKWYQHTGAIEEEGKGCCRQGKKCDQMYHILQNIRLSRETIRKHP